MKVLFNGTKAVMNYAVIITTFLHSYPFHCLSLDIFNQELERERFAAKCAMLQKKNTEMSKKISELEEVITCRLNLQGQGHTQYSCIFDLYK